MTDREINDSSGVEAADIGTDPDTDIATDTATEDDATAAGPEPASTTPRPESGGAGRLLVPIALVVLLVTSALFATLIYLKQYRPDQQTDDTVATAAMTAATEGTVSLLSYSPDTLEQDFTNARARLTGDFLSYYTQFTNDIVTPAAKQKNVKTTATVVRSAVADLQPDAATVLVFINQNTTSTENPGGSFTASAVKVGLVKNGDSWLISAFDPI